MEYITCQAWRLLELSINKLGIRTITAKALGSLVFCTNCTVLYFFGKQMSAKTTIALITAVWVSIGVCKPTKYNFETKPSGYCRQSFFNPGFNRLKWDGKGSHLLCLGKQNRTTKAYRCYSSCLHTSNSFPLISGTFHGQWALIKHLHSFKGVSLKGYCLGFLHRTHKKLQIQL